MGRPCAHAQLSKGTLMHWHPSSRLGGVLAVGVDLFHQIGPTVELSNVS